VSPATCRWGIYCHRGTNSLTKKYVGPTFRWGLSLGKVLPSSLPHQLFPSDISLGMRHFAGDRVPQRHVAGERVGMLLGKASNVVVETDYLSPSYPLLNKGPFFTRLWASRNKMTRSSILGPASQKKAAMTVIFA
ncbi:hypothetical protein Tco_0880026, partial [Tanacetum coccineum]